MTRLRWFSALIGLAFVLVTNAQNNDEEAKEKLRQKLLLAESVQSDIVELALEENRAIALAKLGNSLWPLDEIRARGMFQEAVSELIAAQTAAEANRKTVQSNELIAGQSTRPQVLNSIAQRDADFALQCFYKTRPAAVQRAMLNINLKDKKITGSPPNDTYLAQGELNMEQSFMRMAADQNPARAAELIKRALKTALSGETLNLLKKLHEKEPQTARELGSEAVSSLLKRSLMTDNYLDHQSFQIAVSFLQDFNRERPGDNTSFRFDGAQMRQLAEKTISFYIEKVTQFGYGFGYQLVPIAEKLMPSAVERLKEADKGISRRGLYPAYADEATQKLMNNETPISEVLAQAPKLPVESRRQVYQQVASRLSGQGNFDQARAVLADNFSGDGLENAMNNLNANYAHHLTNQGKFAEAEALIDQFPDSNRYSALVSLASTVFSRDQKDKSYAVNLLEKARGQLPAKPETNAEMSYLMQIASAYSMIEPADARRMLEDMAPRINELMEAAIVVYGFQGSYNIRRGEMPVSQGNSLGVHIDSGIFRNIAKTDFEGAVSLISTFSRREMRIILKQQLLESL